MNLILDLTLHGALAFLLIGLLNRLLEGHLRAADRRVWWALVPLAFLVAIPLPVLPATARVTPFWEMWIPQGDLGSMTSSVPVPPNSTTLSLLPAIWLIGALIYLLVVALQTRTALHRWSRERLCTDSALLNLLEDCKEKAGITAPIGLVVVDDLSAPALLGWLRPRILLPRRLISSMPAAQLQAVLFHELAHFHCLDIPLNWLFTLARALHWFNPMAHLATFSWTRFREEAADETAMAWMKDSSGTTYGEALLHTLRQAHGTPAPFGALAIGESIHNLKRRITMLNHPPRQSPRFVIASLVLIVIIAGLIVRPTRADDASDPRPAAVAAMQSWLAEIDQDKYDQSWKDASAFFQKAMTSAQWTDALNAARTPLGSCTSRKLASSLHQTSIPSPTGVLQGDFVVAQFNSSFENLAYAVETVCFEKAADGTWKASGYFVKPKP